MESLSTAQNSSLRACITASWLKKPVTEISRADGREMLREMEVAGKSRGFQKHVKHTVNVVFKWGIEERVIRDVHQRLQSALGQTIRCIGSYRSGIEKQKGNK